MTRPTKLFSATGALASVFVLLSCGENPAGVKPGQPRGETSLPQLQVGVGQAPVAFRGGSLPPIPSELQHGFEGAPKGPAVSLSVQIPNGFSAPRALMASSASSVRHLLLENQSTGDRALWVLSNGSIVNSASLGNITTSWHIKGSGDYNADGHDDILWENLADGSRAIWLMDGNGGVLQAVPLGVLSTDWRIAGGGDYDGDGHDDILLENIATGLRAIWLMNGGQVTRVVVIGTLYNWHMIAAPDLNSDGKADILLESTTNGNKVLWTMSGGAVQGATLLGTLAMEWKLATATDINGDGHTDILLENTSTGARAAWLEDGFGGVTSAPLITYLDPVWHMAAALTPTRSATTLVISNYLIDPVDVAVSGPGGGVLFVPPSTQTTMVVRVSTLSVSFNMQKPTTASGTPIGDDMAGIYADMPNPPATVYVDVTNLIGTQYYFSPLITNSSAAPLLMAVNWGLVAENRCNCTAPANGINVNIGYYRLFSNTEVRGYGARSGYGVGSYAFWRYSDFSSGVATNTGVVHLTNTSTLLSPHPGLKGLAGNVAPPWATSSRTGLRAPPIGSRILGQAKPRTQLIMK